MSVAVLRADARRLPLPDGCVDLVVTSPPYFGLRSYTDGGEHYAGQIGSEPTPAEWLASLWACTAEWMRVLKPEGSLFVNLGDKYSERAGPGHDAGTPGRIASRPERPRRKGLAETGVRPKSLLGLPWRYALGCMDQLGLILRAEIIWAKPNGLPESVTDRVRRAHEQVFHFTRQPRYYSAVDEIREPHESAVTFGRRHNGAAFIAKGKVGSADGTRHTDGNPRGKLPGSVWDIPSQPLTVPPALGVDHFAAFPMELPRRIITGWSPPGVCTACNQGRRPVVDKRLNSYHDGIDDDSKHYATRISHRHNWMGAKAAWGSTEATITGYACACPQPDAPTRPAIVLDPFGGTGTTALLASVLGRHGITADLSADYCRLATWRTRDPGERARAMQVPKPPPVADGQEALFTL